MPNLPSFSLPADAAAKIEEKAKTVDYYSDLSDEERAEEGLPSRTETEAEPEKKPEPETETETETEEEPESDEAIAELFKEVASLREDIAGKKSDPATKEEEDELISSLLDSTDPKEQLLGERLQDLQQRLEARETEARNERIDRQLAKDDAEFDAVQDAYLIGGKPMTDKQVEQVEDYILKHPDVGRTLTIEQITRAVFPDAMRRPKAPPATGPGANGDGVPVATIVDQGATGGGGKPAPWKPGPNETIESAISAYARTRGMKR